MITDLGKGLVARKLSGVSDSCFDYMAVGIGARPSPNSTVTGPYLAAPRTALRHEIIRVPVISALPTSDGKIKCVAELPSSFVCEFTEVGLWTHRENTASNRPQSQQLCSFQPYEGWKYNGTTQISTVATVSGDVDFARHNSATNKVMHSSYDDILWTVKTERRARKEGFRLGSYGALIRGDVSTATGTGANVWAATGNYVSTLVNGLPFDASSLDDELGISYFVSTNTSGSTTPPSATKLSVHFVTSDAKYAKWNIERGTAASLTATSTTGSTAATWTGGPVVRRGDYLTGTGLGYSTEVYPTSSTGGTLTYAATASGTNTWGVNAYDFSTSSLGNTYYADYTKLSETATGRNAITYDTGFKWANVVEIRVYGSTGGTSHWIGLDSLIFTNTDQSNPSYGMMAYDIAFNYETRGIQTRVNSPTNVLFEVSVV